MNNCGNPIHVFPATKTWSNLTSKPEITVGDQGYATFAAAVTAISSTPATLIIPSGNHVAGGVTVPATLTLRPVHGAVFTVADLTTFTINGTLEAGLYQIFSCTGTGKVVFGDGAAKEAYPELWGAAGTGGDDYTYFVAALASGAKKVKVLPGKTYLKTTATAWLVPSKVTVSFGSGTIIKPTAADVDLFSLSDSSCLIGDEKALLDSSAISNYAGVMIEVDTANFASRTQSMCAAIISGLRLEGKNGDQLTQTSKGIYIHAERPGPSPADASVGAPVRISKVSISNMNYGIHVVATYTDEDNNWLNAGVMNDIWVANCIYGITLDGWDYTTNGMKSSCDGWVLDNIILQPYASTLAGLTLNCSDTKVNVFVWDASLFAVAGSAIIVADNALRNYINTNISMYYMTCNPLTNKITTTGSSQPSIETKVIPPTSYDAPSFAGNQDDGLVFADKKYNVLVETYNGATWDVVTLTNLTYMFSPQGQEYVTLDAVKPTRITISMYFAGSNIKSWYAFGANFSAGYTPAGLKIENYFSGSYKTLMDSTLGTTYANANTSFGKTLSQGFSACSDVRYTFTPNGTIAPRVVRLWGLNSGYNVQRAFLQSPGTLQVQSKVALLPTASGASVSWNTVMSAYPIPAGSLVLGVVGKVDTAITGATSYTVGDGTTADLWGTACAVGVNQPFSINKYPAATISPVYKSAATDIILTAVGGNFSGGVVRVIVYYMTMAAPY